MSVHLSKRVLQLKMETQSFVSLDADGVGMGYIQHCLSSLLRKFPFVRVWGEIPWMVLYKVLEIGVGNACIGLCLSEVS